MTEQQTINLKQLSERAGVEPRTIRRILRAKFPRANKDDPQIEQILKAVKNNHKPAEKPQPEKPKAQNKATKTATKLVTHNGKKAVATPSKPEAKQEPAKAES